MSNQAPQQPASESGAALLRVEGGTKRFGAVTALSNVSLTLGHNEILALLGDNGAGKSTLIRCLSGVHQLDAGTIRLDGEEVSPRSPIEARRLGIDTVYQDLALFDNLSAAENFYAGRELSTPRRLGPFGFVRKRAMNRGAREAVNSFAVSVPDVNLPVGLMSGGQRQAVAVLRAEAFASRVVILDEPTAALGVRETRQVLKSIGDLRDRGLSVILISHNLEDVVAVADRAVVLSRGCNVGEGPATSENREQLVSWIVSGHNGGGRSTKGSNG